MENPIRKLRKLIGLHPSLREFGSQRGFGDLIDRSENYVRGLESSGRITKKIAGQIEARTGVSSAWLLDPGSSPEVIPAAEGGIWDCQMLIARIQAEIASNNVEASRLGKKVAPRLEAPDPFVSLVDGLLREIRPVILEELNAGNREKFDQIMGMLIKR